MHCHQSKITEPKQRSLHKILILDGFCICFWSLSVWFSAHVHEVGFSARPEHPVDDGRGLHLSSHLTGDASQLELPSRHGLRVRIHLGTGAAAQRHCGAHAIITQTPSQPPSSNSTRLQTPKIYIVSITLHPFLLIIALYCCISDLNPILFQSNALFIQ